MRFEILDALLDFVALRRWPDRGGGRDRLRCIGKRLLGCPDCNGQVRYRLALDVPGKRHRALDQCVKLLLPVHHPRPQLPDNLIKRGANVKQPPAEHRP